MGEPITKDQAETIIRAISHGYHDRKDYPPFALDAFTDRNRFQKYVEAVIRDQAKSP